VGHPRQALHAHCRGSRNLPLSRVVALFVEAGADINETDSDGNSLAHLRPEYTSTLVPHGFNPNQRNRDGLTPLLHFLSSPGRRINEAVRHLLDCKADVEARDSVGRTAWEVAKSNGVGKKTLRLLEVQVPKTQTLTKAAGRQPN